MNTMSKKEFYEELERERKITIGSQREAIVELLVEMARYEESQYRNFMWQAHQEVEAILHLWLVRTL